MRRRTLLKRGALSTAALALPFTQAQAVVGSPTQPGETPPWLAGNWAPTNVESTEVSLKVEGSIPPELNGRYLRVGPNPVSGQSPHAFLGDGMVHGVKLADGKADWYRNRWVRTPHYEDPEANYFKHFGSLDYSLANTHVVGHAGRVFALEELHLPYELDEELNTVGTHDFAGKLTGGMTAHPKICPKTGEMLFFGYALKPPFLTYHRVSADGALVQSEPIKVKAATMMHDFNITENYVIFMDLRVLWGGPMNGGLPVNWSDEYGARLGVMPRNGTDADVKWFDIDPCYVFHPMNAYESGDEIIIDVCRSEHKFKVGAPKASSKLHRWAINLRTGKVSETPLNDQPVGFPRVADDRMGQPYRYGYTLEADDNVAIVGKRYLKFDMQSATSEAIELDGRLGGEPVFVPAAGATAEDDGYLLAFVQNPANETSEFVVLNASEPDKGSIARIELPVRVPFGFHGSWVAS